MATNVSTSVLPNPITPMAFLPQELAFQVTISSYIVVGSLGALVWNILSNINSDYRLLSKYPIKTPTVAYFFSRFATFAFVLLSTIFETAPVDMSCRRLNKVIDWMYAIAISSTSFLFLIRVLAVFHRHTFVRIFFVLMWPVVVAGVLTAPQGVVGANIGPTRCCIVTEMESYVAATVIAPLVNDTLVFLAISWKMMDNTYAENPTLKSGLRAFFRGDYLPAFSRGLLQDGQVYYLTSVSTNLVTVIVFFLSFIPPVYRVMFSVPNVLLMNVMACRVYKRTKFGQYSASDDTLNDVVGNSKIDRILLPLAFIRPKTTVQSS